MAIQDPDEVLIDRDEGCTTLSGGLLISIWVSRLHDDLLQDIRRAVQRAVERHPEGVAILSMYRLDRRFPIDAHVRTNLGEIRDTLSAIRPHVRATSTVLEFGGFLAATMKLVSTGMLRVAAPNLPARFFSSRVEATQWVLPHIPAPPEDLRKYLDAAARADALLARRGVKGRPRRSAPSAE
jgi:hypothetical protein